MFEAFEQAASVVLYLGLEIRDRREATRDMMTGYKGTQEAAASCGAPANHPPASRPKLAWQLAKLVGIGALSEAIYLAYVVAFPLVPHTQGAHVIYDVEKLARGSPWLAVLYFVGLTALFILYWRAVQAAKEVTEVWGASAHEQTFKLVILVFGLVFGLTLVWLYPVSANDLFRYVLRGRIWAVYGASPMLHPPNDFPNDPYIMFAGEFGDWVSGYGPLWELLVQIPMRLGATGMTPGAISLKFLALFFYLVSVVLIGWAAGRGGQAAARKQRTPLMGLLLFAWNPMVLLEGMGNGHNDMVWLALLIVGLLLWERRLWWATAVALSLAAMAKATGLLALPIFGVIVLRDETSWGRRLLKGTATVCIFLVLAYASYRMVGPIEETIHGVRDMLTTRRGYAIASALRVMLREIIPGDVSEPIPRTTGQYLFMLFYVGLLWQIWRGRLNLPGATFLAYFAQLIYGSTFRVWYPIWLAPLAALYPAPAMVGRMLLFSFAGEMYVLNTFLWRWWLSNWAWVQSGPTARHWLVINLLAAPWFMIPLFGPMAIRRRPKKSGQ